MRALLLLYVELNTWAYFNCLCSTETGSLTFQLSKPESRLGNDWEYFRFPSAKHLVVELVPYEGSSSLFEPVLIVGLTLVAKVLKLT